MVGECANPHCGAPFRYSRDGKLFRLELGASAASVRTGPNQTRRVAAKSKIFGLCGSCASRATLVSEDGVGVRTQPLRHSVVSHRYLSRKPR